MDKSKISASGGELRVRDLVISTGDNDFAYLVGEITEIHKLGTPEHDTENETDDIVVNFTIAAYSDARIKEIEAAASELYGEPKTFDEFYPNMVIMAPEELIKITDLAEDEFNSLLESEAQAKAFCDTVPAKQK
jgi:hypothetical protein